MDTHDDESHIKKYLQQNRKLNSICSLFPASDYYRPLCYEELPEDIRDNIKRGLLFKKAKTKPRYNHDWPRESSWVSLPNTYGSKYKDYVFRVGNNQYKVFFNAGQRKLWYLTYNWVSEPKFHDKLRFNVIAFLICTVTLLGLLIRKQIKERKLNRYLNEPIKKQILRVCNPQQFMNPYDEKKVSISNNLYNQARNCEDNNIEELKRIRSEASKALGVNFIEQSVVDALIKKVNPKNFIKPYNPEILEKANKLYAMLMSENLSIDEFEDACKIIIAEFS